MSQKVAYQCLSGKRIPYDFKRLVSARLARYFPLESFESCIPSALDHYKSSHATLGFAPALSHFRIICNHWCTFSRFGKKDHPCCFGCGFHSDLVSHTVVCPKFLKLFFGTCRIPYHSIEFRDLVLLRGPWIGQSLHRVRFILLASHICFLCFHACRHGSHFSSRLVLHKLYGYTRKHTKAAMFIRHFRYHERIASAVSLMASDS